MHNREIWGVLSLLLAHWSFWLLIICYRTEHHHAVGSVLLQSEFGGYSWILQLLSTDLVLQPHCC